MPNHWNDLYKELNRRAISHTGNLNQATTKGMQTYWKARLAEVVSIRRLMDNAGESISVEEWAQRTGQSLDGLGLFDAKG